MSLAKAPKLLLPMVAALTLVVGCAAPPQPSFSLDRRPLPELLVRPKSSNWASNLIAGKALSEAQRALGATAPGAADRALQAAVSNQVDLPSIAFGGSASTGSISSAPTYFYGDGTAYWLTDTGWVLRRNAAGVANAFKVPGTDTFPNTALVISNDGKRLYLHSREGNFYALNASTGAHISGSPIALGGNSALVGFSPPPAIDALASLPSGESETLYVVSNTGILARIFSNRTAGTVAHQQSFALPLVNTAPYTELVRSGPTVLDGRVVVSVWRRHATTNTLDQGAIIDYNAKAGASVRRVDLAAPAWAPPAVEYDFNVFPYTPLLAFVPTGASATMVNLTTGETARSVPLVVDNTTPVSGNLNGYAYSAAGISTVTVTPTANTALTLYSDNAMDAANLHGAATVGNGDNRTAIGLMRFPVTTATVTVGGVIKAITNADLSIRVNAAPLVPLGGSIPTRVFRVDSELGTAPGTAYTSLNLNFANRPLFLGSLTAVTNNAADWAANATWEATPNTDNVFTNNTDTVVSAKGLVGAVNQDYAFAELHADPQTTFLSALLGGRTAPRFAAAGANPPRLTLTLSQTGFVNPTVSNPLIINGFNNTVVGVMCNSVFQLDFGGGVANPTFDQRAATFMDDSRTQFCLTRLGRNTDALGTGPRFTVAGNPRYVENTCPAALTVNTSGGQDHLYVLDEHPNTNRVSVNRFTLGSATTAPTLDSSLLLTNASGAAETPTNSVAWDFAGNRLFFATRNNANTSGRAWVVNRF